ncbi:MAG: hypothetical protein ACSHWQ_00350 [Spongiibacteraceae bacterium]
MDTSILLWGLLFSSIGLGYFIYGRKQSQIVFRYSGIALMIYPYFAGNTLTIIAVGVVLLLAPKFIRI